MARKYKNPYVLNDNGKKVTVYGPPRDKLTDDQKQFLDQYEYKGSDDSSGLLSSLKDMGAGFGNEMINMGNVVPSAINPILRHLGASRDILPQVSHLQGNYDPNSLSYTAGQIGGDIMPFLGAERGIMEIAEKAPELAKSLLTNPFVKSSLAGAAAGGATANPNQIA